MGGFKHTSYPMLRLLQTRYIACHAAILRGKNSKIWILYTYGVGYEIQNAVLISFNNTDIIKHCASSERNGIGVISALQRWTAPVGKKK